VKHEFAEIHSFFPWQVTIFFLEAVGSLLRLSVVEQEKGEKAGQNPEHRAENSEPEWNVPACAGDDIGFCLGHVLFLVSCLPLVETPEHAACPC